MEKHMPGPTETFMSGRTKSKLIRFSVEDELQEVVDLPLTHRGWDVTDPIARDAAAKEELGDDYGWYSDHREDLQWWVNADANIAALAIYRPR